MVLRSQVENIEEFEGEMSNIQLEPSTNEHITGSQWHFEMSPLNKALLAKSATGKFHEWVKQPGTATDETVPEGCALDRYVQEIEMVHSETKKMTKVSEVFKSVIGKKYLFKKKKLGKAFKGFEAKEYWVPVKEIK